MYGIEEARHQYEALRGAAEVSPVLQCRAQLFEMGREWADAGRLLKDLSEPVVDDDTGEVTGYDSDRWTIVVAGAVIGGMQIASTSKGDDNDVCKVIRTMSRDGQLSLHVTHSRSDAGTYVNLSGPASPVVVVA